MALPLLAPGLPKPETYHALEARMAASRPHTTSEWAIVYPEIERLYIRERRKLRHIMQYMADEHGFLATEQMYKKRFAKWGFQKNSKRPTGGERVGETQDSHGKGLANRSRLPPVAVTVSVTPGMSPSDSIMLVLLTSVRTWSKSFFETIQAKRNTSSLQCSQSESSQPGSEEAKETNYALKLAIGLLARGQGELAGRVVRKAFLIIETTLSLEGPALLWNLLEIMYSLVESGQTQLFRMLLTHLTALTHGRLPTTHPLPATIRSLRSLASGQAESKHSRRPAPVAQSSPPTSAERRKMITQNPNTASRTSSFLLQQAWTLNAGLLLEQFEFDIRELYFRMNWDACTMDIPLVHLSTAKQKLLQTNAARQQAFYEPRLETHPAVASLDSSLDGRNTSLKQHQDIFLPENYKTLRLETVQLLRQRCISLFGKDDEELHRQRRILPRFLAGMALAHVFEGSLAAAGDSLYVTDGAVRDVPPIHAAHVACMLRMLVDLDSIEDPGNSTESNIERLRAIVALREYALGESDPQVVHEMWILADALRAGGNCSEAERIKEDAHRRLEAYVADIPAYLG